MIVIPEYKCRRCGVVFDGTPTIESIYSIDTWLDFAFGNNHVQGTHMKTVEHHEECNGWNYVQEGWVFRGVGLGDLIGARDAATKHVKE